MIDRRCSESLGSRSLTRQAAHPAIYRSAPLGWESLDDAVRTHFLPSLPTGLRSSHERRVHLDGDHRRIERSRHVSAAAPVTTCPEPIWAANDQGRRLRHRHRALHVVMIHLDWISGQVGREMDIPLRIWFSRLDGSGAGAAQGRRTDELATYGSFIRDVRAFRSGLSGFSVTRAVHDRHRAPSVRRPCGGRTCGRGQLGAPDEEWPEPDRARGVAPWGAGSRGRGVNARGFPGALTDPGRQPRTCRRDPWSCARSTRIEDPPAPE